MLTYQILEDDNIAVIEPKGPLSEADIRQLGKDIDLHLVRTGNLKGVLIHTAEFPGWDSIGTMASHLKFIGDHHRLIKKVAIASDGRFASVIPKLANHFVSAEVKGFGFNERDKAMAWLRDSSE